MAAESLSKLKRLQAEALALWEEKWVEEGEQISLWRRFVRFWLFVGRSFARNRCPVRASALAYTTLLALVPLLAVAISISTSLLKTETKTWVSTVVIKVAPQLGIRTDGSSVTPQQVIDTINTSIDKIQSGALGISGLVALAFIAISLLSNIENTMNDIWGVARGRSWFTRIIYYWAVITLVPSLILFAMGINTGPYFKTTQLMIEQSPWLTSLITFILPLIVLTPTFALFYYLMPNTKVEWRAARLGGLVAAVLLHLNNKFSVIYFAEVVRNSKIYGGLGGLPIFLIGLYFSWMILLLGAQVAYAYQNRRSYFQEKQADNINQRGREFVALRIMTLLAQRFSSGERPPDLIEIAEALSVPSRLVNRIIEPLLQTKILVEVAGAKPDEIAYTPARPLQKITCQNVLDAMRSGVGQEVATKEDSFRDKVHSELEKVREAERRTASEMTLEELVRLASEKGATRSAS